MTDEALDAPIPPKSNLPVMGMVLGILGFFCPFFVLSAVAVVLGMLALGKLKRGEIDPEQKNMALGAVITGGLGIATALMITLVLGLLLPPTLRKAQVESQLRVEMNNLRQLATGVYFYADEHDSALPMSLGDVADGYIPPGDVYVSPGSGTPAPTTVAQVRSGSNCDYVLLWPGQPLIKVEYPSKTVMIYGKPGNFKGAICVAFIDGHVEVDKKTNQLELAATQNGWLIPKPEAGDDE